MVGIADVIRRRAKMRDYYTDLKSEVSQQGLIETMLKRRKRSQAFRDERISSAVIERIKKIGKRREQTQSSSPPARQEIPSGGIPPPEVRPGAKIKVQ